MPETPLVQSLAEELDAAIDHLRTDYPAQADMDLEYDALPHVTLWWDDDRFDETWTLYVDYMPNRHKPGPERWEGRKQWRRSMFSVDPVELASTILTDLS